MFLSGVSSVSDIVVIFKSCTEILDISSKD